MAKKTISVSVEEKLKALYDLQCVDSEIDQLRIVRGELPVEIQDLEDENVRIESRLEKFTEEKSSLKDELKARKESRELRKESKKQSNRSWNTEKKTQ